MKFIFLLFQLYLCFSRSRRKGSFSSIFSCSLQLFLCIFSLTTSLKHLFGFFLASCIPPYWASFYKYIHCPSSAHVQTILNVASLTWSCQLSSPFLLSNFFHGKIFLWILTVIPPPRLLLLSRLQTKYLAICLSTHCCNSYPVIWLFFTTTRRQP